MQLKCTKFSNNQLIPPIYTCIGQNINPQLDFFDVPPQAKSLALVVTDPDSPSGNFVHWIVWNISIGSRIEEGRGAPQGSSEGLNDFGKIGYGGPCPHQGTHRYVFTLYALNDLVDLEQGSKLYQLEEFIKNRSVATAQLVGKFKI